MLQLPLLFALLLGGGRVLCEELRINNTDDFINFSNNVNSGTNYKGVTVLLDSDIDLSGRTFEPIGNETNSFLGIFDGQGYTISNFVINSTSQFVGLFGYSEGTTIKNVVMDFSCSITSSFVTDSYDNAYVGGIIGYCYSRSNSCIIQNIINMASVSFKGIVDNKMYLGGIVGYLYSRGDEFRILLTNCANYGPVSHVGESDIPHIGGIVGCHEEYRLTPNGLVKK